MFVDVKKSACRHKKKWLSIGPKKVPVDSLLHNTLKNFDHLIHMRQGYFLLKPEEKMGYYINFPRVPEKCGRYNILLRLNVERRNGKKRQGRSAVAAVWWCSAAWLVLVCCGWVAFASLFVPSSLGLASCNSVSRSLLPAPSAVRVQSARLKDAIVSWWTSFSVWQLLVSLANVYCYGRRIVVCWLGGFCCLQLQSCVISACLIARLRMRLYGVDCASYVFEFSEIPGWSCQ